MDNNEKNASMRSELLDRVVNDFTYKAEFSEAQGAQWQMVKNHFDMFRSDVEGLMDRVSADEQRQSSIREKHWTGYQLALREVERWCNTAIANDFQTGSPVDMMDSGISVPSYEGPSGGELERHKICDTVSQICFDSIVFLVSVLPVGRALSVAVTRMQDVRGWLLDTVNHQYDEVIL